MKPVVKISCLPHDRAEDWYVNLQVTIVAAVVAANVGISNENDMIVLMPMDLMKKGLGQEIIVEINFVRMEQYKMLSATLNVVKKFNRDAYVEGCFTYGDGGTAVLTRLEMEVY